MNYSKENLENAIALVKQKKMSCRAANNLFNIPRSTLKGHILGGWPILSIRVVQNLPSLRAKFCNEKNIDSFFKIYEDLLSKLGLQDKPQNIFKVFKK